MGTGEARTSTPSTAMAIHGMMMWKLVARDISKHFLITGTWWKNHHMAARKKRVCIHINSFFFVLSLSLYTHTHTRKHLYPYRHLHLSLYLHLYLDHSRSISTSVSVNPKCHPKYKSFQIIPWKLWVKLILHIRWTHDLHEIRLYKPTATNHLGKFLFASHFQGEIPAMSYFWWFNKCLMVRPSYSHDSTHFPRSTMMCWWYPQ